MKALNKLTAPKSVAPERIIQFGEGGAGKQLVFILRAGCPASVMRQTARGDAIPWRGRGFF